MKSTRAINVVGAHAAGEVGHVITGGVLPPKGRTLEEMRQSLKQDDTLGRLLIREPRGGVFTHYNLIVPPIHTEADAGFIIMEPCAYPPMSGSNAMCVATVLLETGMLPITGPIYRDRTGSAGRLGIRALHLSRADRHFGYAT